MGGYSKVNDALNDAFLDGRFAGRPLYLVLDNRARREIAQALNVSLDGVEDHCCRVVGDKLRPHGDPYEHLTFKTLNWRVSNSPGKPPFTALLFTLAHAAERMVSDQQFSSGNYYQRLAEITGVSHGRLSQFGVSTEKFWHVFSRWLAENDYAFGRPTASAVNSFRYVSLAMSQAIVREADRECFHHLFEKYGFSGTDTISAAAMAQYIDAWMHGSGPSQRLKAAWQKQELRERISEVAIAELEEWTSSDASGGRSNACGNRLSLASAIIPDFPTPRLLLSIGLKAELAGDVPLAGKRPADPGALVLSNSLYGGFATLAPPHVLEIQRVMRAGIELEDAARSAQYSWRSRFAIPLAQSENGNYWTEVQRTTAGTRHCLLVHEAHRETVEDVLAESAMPGYSVATDEQLRGLPGGWLLFQDVIVLHPVDGIPADIAGLSPMSDSGGLVAEGGLLLERGIWHRRAPPRIKLLETGNSVGIEAWEGDDEPTSPIAMSFDNVLQLDPGQIPQSGVVTARGTVNGQHAGTLPLLFRTARRPRPIDRQSRGRLAYGDLLTASDITDVGSGLFVEGPVVHGPTGSLSQSGLLDRFTETQASSGAEAEKPAIPQPAPPAARVRTDDVNLFLSMSCVERGRHVWVYETVPPNYPRKAKVNKECRGCGLAVLEHRNPRPAAAPSSETKAPAWKPRELPARRDIRDHDLVLDALCFLGNGSWGSLERLAGNEDGEPWQAIEMAKALSALGHVDLELQRGCGRVAAWSVPAPSLAFRSPTAAILAGFRNQRLVNELKARVSAAGGTLTETPQDGGPVLVAVEGLDVDAAASAISDLPDPHGRAVTIVADAPRGLAAACAAMPGIGTLLSPVTPGNPDMLQRYDLAQGRWRNREAIDGPGAYRYQYAGQTYVYVDQVGTALQGPHEVVKLLAARDAQANLHCYDQESREFLSVLGCEPPGLLGRALVACSGRLPRVDAGRTTYRDVPPEVAATVLEILYCRELHA